MAVDQLSSVHVFDSLRVHLRTFNISWSTSTVVRNEETRKLSRLPEVAPVPAEHAQTGCQDAANNVV